MEHKMEKEEERGGKGEILFDWNLWAKGITCILTKLSHVPLLCSSLAALITHEHFVYHMIACTHTHKVKYNEFQYYYYYFSTSMILKTPCPKLMKSFPTTY